MKLLQGRFIKKFINLMLSNSGKGLKSQSRAKPS